MSIISPVQTNKHVEKLLDKIGAEFEIIPVQVEEWAKENNCYQNVAEKVKMDGGKVHYGWVVFQTDILCEAERHAVWETPAQDLIDITPRKIHFNEVMFITDNDDFVYEGQQVDNIRINTTNNSIVDDFIMLCENKEALYIRYQTRIDDERVLLPPPVREIVTQLESSAGALLNYIRSGGTPTKKCFCGHAGMYKNCHGKDLKKNVSGLIRNLHIEMK